MNAAIEDISSMLLAETTLGLVFGTSLHLYKEPAQPHNTVTLFETTGMPPIVTLGSNKDTKHYEKPSIQIRVRNSSAADAYALAYEIQKRLQARAQETWGDYFYSVVYAVGNPFELDWDLNNRIRVVLNFNIQRRLS